jgi:hypothetical protein
LQFRKESHPFQLSKAGQFAGNHLNEGIGFQVKMKRFVVSISESGGSAQQITDGNNADERTINERLVGLVMAEDDLLQITTQ